MRRMQESLSRITVYQLKQQNEMVSVTGRERTQAQTGIQSSIRQLIYTTPSAQYIHVGGKIQGSRESRGDSGKVLSHT